MNSGEKEQLVEPCTQYATGLGGYSPVGLTRDRLPAGSYDIEKIFGKTIILPKKIVHDELIELDDSPSQKIMNDIRKFWSLKDRYSQMGFVHKRGFLLHGPPGTGKTCVTNLVAVNMQKSDGITIYCQWPQILAPVLKEIREVEPSRPIVVVIEDIDSVIDHGYEDQLLTLLDGQETVNSVAFIATTNHLDTLPDRIAKRPSRFDRVIEVEAPGPNVRRQFLLKRGCGDLSKKELERWVRLTDGLTIAHMKELIISVLLLENDLEAEAERLRGTPIEESDSKKERAEAPDDEDMWD